MEVSVSQTDCFCQCCQSNRRKHQQEILEIRDSHAENVRNMRDSIQSLMTRYEETRAAVEEARLDAEKHAVASQAAAQAALKHIQEFSGLQRERPSEPSDLIDNMGVDQVIENLSASLSVAKDENTHLKSALLEAEQKQQERIDSLEAMANEIKALTEKIQAYESERSRALSQIDVVIGTLGDKEDPFDQLVGRMVSVMQTNSSDIADLTLRYSDMESCLAEYHRFEEGLLKEVLTDLHDKSKKLATLSLCASAGNNSIEFSEEKMYLNKVDASGHRVENLDCIVKAMMSLLKRSIETCHQLSSDMQMIQNEHAISIRDSEEKAVERKMAITPIKEIKEKGYDSCQKVEAIAIPVQNEAQEISNSSSSKPLCTARMDEAAVEGLNMQDLLPAFSPDTFYSIKSLHQNLVSAHALHAELDRLKASNAALEHQLRDLRQEQEEQNQQLSSHSNPAQKLQYFKRIKAQLDLVKREYSKLVLENYELEQCVKYLKATAMIEKLVNSESGSPKLMSHPRDALSPLSLAGRLHQDTNMTPSTLMELITKADWKQFSSKLGIESRILQRIDQIYPDLSGSKSQRDR